MSHTWKLLPLAAFAALGAFMLLPGGAAQPDVASALDCDNTSRLRIEIQDIVTGNRITEAGAIVRIDPDPIDDSGTRTYVDNGTNDDSDTTGRIDEDNACETEEGEEYTIELIDLPDELDCVVVDEQATTELEDNVTVVLEVVNCEESDGATPTTTVGPAATVIVQSSNATLGCGATSIITVTVRDAGGDPVAAGTVVNILADLGTVSPTSGQTVQDGSVFVFYTAPSNQGGEATISAIAGGAQGSAEVDINCNVQPTQAPPPTTAPSGGGIQPPNTGDGGLAGGSQWQTYAGVAIILSSIIATLAAVRHRA